MSKKKKKMIRPAIYYSRFSPDLHHGYGAFIDWQVGETALVRKPDLTLVRCEIKGETQRHKDAPHINGAHGFGQWIRVVRFEGEEKDVAISEASLLLESRHEGEEVQQAGSSPADNGAGQQ